ncbi:MAG: hypothetical protein CMD74_04235 [Gammaproteobacteria bacterium]|nr:hypothetical protein [Gammaproteobacteria bacterium]
MPRSTISSKGRNHSRTPCIGVCSTTYGDLVCRGCKRFAHEIVGWNGFSGDQHKEIWERLAQLREGSIRQTIKVTNPSLLKKIAIDLELSDVNEINQWEIAYQVLVESSEKAISVAEFGIESLSKRKPKNRPAIELVRQIDDEFLRRSRAIYERNYKISAD